MKYRTKTMISIRTTSIIAIQPVKKNECTFTLDTGEKIQIAESYERVLKRINEPYPRENFRGYVRFKSREGDERNV